MKFETLFYKDPFSGLRYIFYRGFTCLPEELKDKLLIECQQSIEYSYFKYVR